MIAILLFRGSISPDVLDNFGAPLTPKGKPYFESRVIQVSFIVVLFCHIPFLFYAGKEGLCIVVDELQRNSISKALTLKLSQDGNESEIGIQKKADRMAYKDMDMTTYVAVSLSLYALEMIGAILVNDITTVFDFASAIAVSFISFWFPSIYYLIAEKRYGKYNRYYHNMAWFLNMLGVLNFALGISTGVLSVVN